MHSEILLNKCSETCLHSMYMCDRYGYGSGETRIVLGDAEAAFHG